MAVAKKGGHSFIMLGVYSELKVQHLLCRVGKFFDTKMKPSAGRTCYLLGQSIFSSAKAQVKDEGIEKVLFGHHPISYQAYDISLNHYIELIRILESIQTKENTFYCYKPININENEVIFERTKKSLFSKITCSDELLKATNSLDTNNTCRHGALKLMEETTHASFATLVSSSFYNDLSCTTYLDHGIPSQDEPFYVAPLPPYVYNNSLSYKQKMIAEKIYKRMEHLVKLEPNAKETREKFSSLKSLYHQLIEQKHEPSLNELLNSISTWKKEHWSQLTKLRKTYIWDYFITRKSATVKMVEELEHDLQTKDSRTCFDFLTSCLSKASA